MSDGGECLSYPVKGLSFSRATSRPSRSRRTRDGPAASPEACAGLRAPANSPQSARDQPVRARLLHVIDLAPATPILHLVKNFTKLETAPDKSLALKSTFELINAQLYSVEERIRQQARAFDPAVEGYVAASDPRRDGQAAVF